MTDDSAIRLRAILETAVEGIITINERGVVSSFNPAAERIFGFQADEVIGENVRLLMPSPYHEQHDGYLDSYLETDQRKIIGVGREVVAQRKDGSTFPMYLSVGEFRVGGARYFTGIVRDISQERHFQESLQRSEAKLRAVFDTIVEGILTIDRQGIIKSLNPAAVRMFGYDEEELLGQNVKMLAPPPFRAEHDSYLASYLATGEKKIIGIGRDVLGRRKDGSTFPMYLSVGEMWIGREQYFTGIARDMTDVNRVQQRETAIGRILEDSLNEIFIFDAESLKFLQVNKGARDNLGYTLDEMRGLTPLDLKPEFTREVFDQLISPLRTGEQERIVFQTMHRRKDGTLYAVEVHLQLTFYDSRPAFVAIILDTSQRKEAETKLLQAERLAAIGSVVSGVAHESRNALQRIQANVELAQMEAEGNTELLQPLTGIARAADGLQSMFEEVRNYAAPVTLDSTTACIAGVWRSAWSHLAVSRTDRDARLEEDTRDAETHCEIDPFRMEQVFRNLFENSLAACQDPLLIRVRCAALGPQGGLRIRVCDNGAGLDPQQRAKVFEAFFTTKNTGTGLGMAIARRIIEAHGGTIAVANPGSGAEFVIELPSRRHVPAPHRPKAGSPEPDEVVE